MSNHIKEILFALADANVEFVVGGGVAGVLHGVERSLPEKLTRWNSETLKSSSILLSFGVGCWTLSVWTFSACPLPLRDKDLIDIKELEKLRRRDENAQD